jgi:LEA14-like dessication related protein
VLHRYVYLLLILLLVGCIPIRRNRNSDPNPNPEPTPAPIATAEPLQPIEALLLTVVPGQTLIERFDPPGAGSTAKAVIGAQAKNTNSFGVTLTHVDYEVFLLDKSVARGSLRPDVFVAPDSLVPLKFPFSASLEKQTDLIKAVAKSFTGTPLAFRLEGSMTFTSQSYGFTTQKVTLLQGDMLSKQKLEPPQLSLNENASAAYTLREGVPIVRVVMDVTNGGDIGYFIYGKDIELYLGDIKIALQDISPNPIAAGQEGSFEILFYPDLTILEGEALKVLKAALQGIPTSLELKGNLSVDVLGVDTVEMLEWEIKGFIYK